VTTAAGPLRPRPARTRPRLYGIATNLIGRHRRTEIRQYRALACTGADPVTDLFTDRVDARVSASAVGRRLAAALAWLSTDHRDTLLLVARGDTDGQHRLGFTLEKPAGAQVSTPQEHGDVTHDWLAIIVNPRTYHSSG
jgi:hypothetical protein